MSSIDVDWEVVDDCLRALGVLRDLLSYNYITQVQHDNYRDRIILTLKAEFDKLLT